MKRKNFVSKLAALSVCAALAAEPLSVYAEAFGAETAAAFEEEEAEEEIDFSDPSESEGTARTAAEENDAEENAAGDDVAGDSTAEEGAADGSAAEENPAGEDLVNNSDEDMTSNDSQENEISFALAEELSEETEETEESAADFLNDGVSLAADEVLTGTCGKNASWKLENGILTISGSGAMDDCEYTTDIPWFGYADDIKEIYVGDGITAIGDGSFFYLTKVTRVVIGKKVKTIGDLAFAYDASLKDLTIGKSVQTIGEGAFYYNQSLASVKFPEGLKAIKANAFAGCSSLKAVTIPSTATEFLSAFSYYTKLTIKNPNYKDVGDGTYVEGINISVKAKQMYSMAFQVLDLVNKERKKKGLSSLKMDQSLLETAMLRSYETVLYFSHTRPCGLTCFSANSKMNGENIAFGQTSAKAVMTSWMNSAGHKANILGSGFTTIGIGCVYFGGRYYWVQCFGSDSGTAAKKGSYSNNNKTRKVVVAKNKSYYTASLKLSASTIKAGKTAKATAVWTNSSFSGYAPTFTLSQSDIVFESSNTSVCTVKNGVITGKKAGTAKIKMYIKGYESGAVTKTIKVTGKAYTVTFNPNGGSVSTKTKTVTAKASIGTLPRATRSGYTFLGWYTAKSGGRKISTATKITKKQTFYAHWKKK